MIESHRIETSLGYIDYLDTKTDKPIFVYIHGAFGARDPIMNLIEYFGVNKYRFIVPSLPGHGNSFSVNKDTKYEDIVQSMAEFFEKLNIKKSIVVGHSLGGRLAMDLSYKKNLNFNTLFLISPLLGPIKTDFVQTVYYITEDFFGDLGTSQFTAIKNYGNKYVFNQFQSLGNIWKIIKSLKYINSTKLPLSPIVIWGKNDKANPINMAQINKIKVKTFKEYPGGHYFFLKDLSWLVDMEAAK